MHNKECSDVSIPAVGLQRRNPLICEKTRKHFFLLNFRHVSIYMDFVEPVAREMGRELALPSEPSHKLKRDPIALLTLRKTLFLLTRDF